MLTPHRTLNCRGRLLVLDAPIVMGILNVTPDSFFDGGRYQSDQEMLNQVEKMLEDGATMIDVGGMSSRPGAAVVSEEEEQKRVLPVIRSIATHFPEAIISVDTVRAAIARASVEAGAHLINDISAGRMDADLYPELGRLKVPYVLMHMQGIPQTMQRAPQYDDAVLEVLDFLIAEVGRLRALGLRDIIVDPGFGFGKSVEHNYQLLKSMHVFSILDLPLLAGISRKSMICRVLDVPPAEALNGTTALHMVALQQGAMILRVHDVKEAVEVIKCWKQLEMS